MSTEAYLKVRATIRKLLGRKIANLVRNSVVYARTALGLIPHEDKRRECVSALMRVYNEELWIEPSMLSVKDLVDEYVVIDASADATPLIVEELIRRHRLNVIYERNFDTDKVRFGQRALELSTCKWILRWDGDFVMHESSIPLLKEFIQKRRRGYYAVYWSHVVLVGDLYHTTREMFHIEHWLSKYAPGARFIRSGDFEYFYLPPDITYRVEIGKPLSFHLKVGKPVDFLLKKYRFEHFKYDIKEPFEDFVRKRVKEEFATESIEEAAEEYYKRLLENTVPYDRRVLDYPKILKEYVKRKLGIDL